MEHTNGHNTPAVAPQSRAVAVDWSDASKQKLLKNTVAQGTSDVEFAMFRELCQATGLNPFRREIWCIITNPDTPGRRQVQIMTGINGYFQVANSHPQFDGLEWEVERDDKGAIVSATAKVWRKDRRIPSTGTALWKEFSKPYGNWKSMPEHMLLKCAKAIALREAFPQELGGTYTEEEMPAEYSVDYDVRDAIKVETKWNPRKVEATYMLMPLKHGSKAGTLLGDESLNQKHLENHLSKYRDDYSTAEQEAIAMRIDDLKRLYARSQDENTSVAAQEAAKRKLQNSDGGERKAVSEVESRRELGDLYPETVDMDDEELEAWTLSRADEE